MDFTYNSLLTHAFLALPTNHLSGASLTNQVTFYNSQLSDFDLADPSLTNGMIWVSWGDGRFVYPTNLSHSRADHPRLDPLCDAGTLHLPLYATTCTRTTPRASTCHLMKSLHLSEVHLHIKQLCIIISFHALVLWFMLKGMVYAAMQEDFVSLNSLSKTMH